MQKYLEMGKVVSTHGVRGEVKVMPWCDSPDEFAGLGALYLRGGEVSVKVEKARVHGSMVILKFAGVDSMADAERFRGVVLFADRDDLSLGDGQFFIADLIGLRVTDADTGEVYGVLSDVSKTGANDVYHVAFADGSERLAPAIPEVVVKVSLESGEIMIRPLRGLFDEN